MKNIVHADSRNITHDFRLSGSWKFGKLLLCLYKTVANIFIMLTNDGFKKFFFTFVISVKGSGSHSHGFHNIPQGSVFISFF